MYYEQRLFVRCSVTLLPRGMMHRLKCVVWWVAWRRQPSEGRSSNKSTRYFYFTALLLMKSQLALVDHTCWFDMLVTFTLARGQYGERRRLFINGAGYPVFCCYLYCDLMDNVSEVENTDFCFTAMDSDAHKQRTTFCLWFVVNMKYQHMRSIEHVRQCKS